MGALKKKKGKKAILVTGGAGYIGSHTALALLDKGEKVVILDNLSEGSHAMVPKKAIFVRGSVEDQKLVRTTIEKYDIDSILHFAAFVKVEESTREPEMYERNNVAGTEALVKVAEESDVRHIIYSGSASVYGNPVKNPISENTPLSPMSPYAETKVRAEKVILDSSLNALSLRYFNPAGVDHKGRAGYRVDVMPTHLMRTVVRAALGLIPHFRVNGIDYKTPDGTCVRDFIHISDLARAHIVALAYLRKGKKYNVFNCGSGSGFSVKQVIDAVKKISGNDFPVMYGSRRPGDPAISVADISRIEKEMKWKPKMTLEDMIRDELAWVKKHRKDIRI